MRTIIDLPEKFKNDLAYFGVDVQTFAQHAVKKMESIPNDGNRRRLAIKVSIPEFESTRCVYVFEFNRTPLPVRRSCWRRLLEALERPFRFDR